jgi:hypothetical protein
MFSSNHHLLLFLTIISFVSSQSTVHIGILDDNDYPKGLLNIIIPNVTVCQHRGLILQIQWINSSNSLADLIDGLELRKNQTNFYLTRTAKFSTKLIQDYCQTYGIPFISMHPYESSLTAFVVLFQIRYLISFSIAVDQWRMNIL